MATRSHCTVCGLTFASVAAFDAHRTGSYGEPIYRSTRSGKSRQLVGYTSSTRRCLSLAEIQAVGMTLNDKGWWKLPDATSTPLEAEEALEPQRAAEVPEPVGSTRTEHPVG